MERLPTVMLHHQTRSGSHYDWLMLPPHRSRPKGEQSLWTARVRVPVSWWPSLGGWLVKPIGMHRRDYLAYEGPVSGGRGTVRRAEAGRYVPLLWQTSKIVINLEMHSCSGRVEVERLNTTFWRCRWLGAT